jgi:hypothetical protein
MSNKCDVCGAVLEFSAAGDPEFARKTSVTSKCRHVISPYGEPKAPTVEGEPVGKQHLGKEVNVNHPRFHGTGILQKIDEPTPRVAWVKLQHGEDRWYEADAVTPLDSTAPAPKAVEPQVDAPTKVTCQICKGALHAYRGVWLDTSKFKPETCPQSGERTHVPVFTQVDTPKQKVQPEEYRYKTSEQAALLPLPLQLLRLEEINEQLCHNHNTLLISGAGLDREVARLKEQLVWIRDHVQEFGKSSNLPVVVSRASHALDDKDPSPSSAVVKPAPPDLFRNSLAEIMDDPRTSAQRKLDDVEHLLAYSNVPRAVVKPVEEVELPALTMNINDEIIVSLTAAGEKAWKLYWALWSDKVPDAIKSSHTLSDGRIRFQLYEAMHIFGSDCYNGSSHLPFVNNAIEFAAKGAK